MAVIHLSAKPQAIIASSVASRGFAKVSNAGTVACLVAMVLGCCSSAKAADTPVTPNASPEVHSLMGYFSDIYGKKILSGQHEGWRGTNELGWDLRHIQTHTGELPAVLSVDFARHNRRRDRGRHDWVNQVVDWHSNRKGIISVCWHWVAPLNGRAFYTKDTKFDPTLAAREGTAEHAAVLADLDAAAEEFKLLREARVPVMWRPMHEANGRWFWWGAGGPEPFKKLWRMMFDRLARHHQLNNLLWVYSPGAGIDLADWYPGDAYVDLIAPDHYPLDGNHDPAKDIFDELVALTGGTKMLGFGENGPVPDTNQLFAQRAGWLFFITWSGHTLTENNTPEELQQSYRHPRVLNLDDLGDDRTFPVQPAGKPVKLGFPAPPSDVAVNGLRRRPVIVAVHDAAGRTVREGKFSVNLALAKHSEAAKLTGTLTAETVNGIATFSDLTMDRAGQGYIFRATASGVRAGESAPFAVGPGAGIECRTWTGAENGAPTTSLITKGLETPYREGTNLSVRFTGFLLPPMTGEYRFWIASEGDSEFWLSPNEDPAHKSKITGVTSQTPYAKWPHTKEAASRSIRLEERRKYYVEILQKHGSGSAHLSVRWRLPNGGEERPIPGWRLAPPDGMEPGSRRPAHSEN